jgi:hypothetical protein
MDAQPDRLTEQVGRATQRLIQLRARQMLRDLRKTAREKALSRAADTRHRQELGGAVLAAHMDDWTPPEIVGLLLDGKDRVGHSTTMRLGIRKRGEAYLGLTNSFDVERPPMLH